ncbi:MAG: GC-type dockerin domain-anchored protein [Planctomycetota bacterium]
MLRSLTVAAGAAISIGTLGSSAGAQQTHVAFLWHMHQPVYVPYLMPTAVDGAGYFSFSVVDVHNQRSGPYTWWPVNAVNSGLSQPHLGAHVSFSGSLIENLNSLEAAGVNGGMWSGWKNAYRGGQSPRTSLGNQRLDLVAFGYHHPLMPLLDERDIRKQIQLHKAVYGPTWNATYSAGMFPPETAFSTRIIPALVAEGIEWVMVDNIHFDRACQNYPHNNAASMFAPNRADQINPDPAQHGGAWVQLQNLWAPTAVSAPFGYRPHKAQHVDPETGAITKMTVVPAARYEGNEDGRGGYGAFLYDQVMDALLPYNTDAQRPLLVLLHHDGDNFGGGSEGYYGHNFQNMVSWVSSDPDYSVTTVQDYLQRFPVPNDAVIHVEDGSWAGADGGDPEFKKWLGDPNEFGVSPDIHSWAVLTAAKNRVFHADTLNPGSSALNILNRTGSLTERAWSWLLVSQASDYWYWDGTEVWDSNVTRGANQAVSLAEQAIATSSAADPEPPTVFAPQREPYNPGAFEWDLSQRMPSDFEVWTLVDDASGVQSVTLYWRIDDDGFNDLATIVNETYAGGAGVGPWTTQSMAASVVPTPEGVTDPVRKADRYGATIAGQSDVLIDYFVEAVDGAGNVRRSPIMHVWVGDASGGNGGGGDPSVAISPDPAAAGAAVTVTYDPSGGPLSDAAQIYAHVGFNGWSTVISPDPIMSDSNGDGIWELVTSVPLSATELNLVFNDGAGTWDNNSGADWSFAATGTPGRDFTMDGSLDSGAIRVAHNGGYSLWADWNGSQLYVATDAPGDSGLDRFLLVSGDLLGADDAPWGKAGTTARRDAFLAAEADNDYSGWFDAASAEQARGAVLEGTIDLASEFGAIPEHVHLAAASYQSADGGALMAATQTPVSMSTNGAIDADEFMTVLLCSLTTEGCCAADLTTDGVNPGEDGYGIGDGFVTVADLTYFVEQWIAPNALVADVTTDGSNPGDAGYGASDGSVSVADLTYYVEQWLAGCP